MDDLRQRLKTHVEALAKEPRVPGTPAHERAMMYIARQLDAFDFTCILPLQGRVRGTPWNVLTLPEPRKERPVFVLGAHYDTVEGSPGADDNASGVAALLEVARLIGPRLKDSNVALQIAAYDLEEKGLLGSLEHCRRLKTTGRTVLAMMSLEMLGYKDSTPGSQKVPGGILAPATGDFLAVIANQESKDLLKCVPDHPGKILKATLPKGSQSEQLAHLSDHGAFWQHGHRALLVTDTAFLRNPHYHQPSDTPGSLDYDFLTESTRVVLKTVGKILGLDPQEDVNEVAAE